MRVALGVMMTCLTACAMPEQQTPPPGPVTFGETTVLYLSDTLVQVIVPVEEGTPTVPQAREVTDCAAAISANRKDFLFARHVRTSLAEEAGIRNVDAVYTLSEAVPRGDFVIDVTVQADTCRELEVAETDG
ncbi:MAG: hypothetical protein AAGA87_18065 [Pseudomonadota bacterium]